MDLMIYVRTFITHTLSCRFRTLLEAQRDRYSQAGACAKFGRSDPTGSDEILAAATTQLYEKA